MEYLMEAGSLCVWKLLHSISSTTKKKKKKMRQ